MEKLKISETAREKLEDAAVSVFMEEYAKALNAGLDQQMEASAAEEFPKELEERCLALIRKEAAKECNQRRRKNTLRVLRSVAAVAIFILSISSVLFVTVEAFRAPVMNFFVEKVDRYWQLSGEKEECITEEIFNPEDPLDGIIQDDFVITNVEGSWDSGCLTVEYCNNEVATINFVMIASDGNTQIDIENANATPYKVLEHDAIISTENDRVRITWLDEEVSRILTLYSTNISEEMIKIYAEDLALRLG